MIVQYNVATMRWPFDDPRWGTFKSRLREVHAAAEKAPGFIKRHRGEDEPLGYIAPYPDELIMGNLSGWQSEAALHEFVFREPHLSLIRDRLDWFEPHDGSPYAVLYESPGVFVWEACVSLTFLRNEGPSGLAWTWGSRP